MNTSITQRLIGFETRMAHLWEDGQLPFLLHLCGGNEAPLEKIFDGIRPGDWVFSTHRSHYHYLLKAARELGWDVAEARLEDMIRAGNSMFVFDRQVNFYTSAILAGTCGIAAGVAWALREAGSPNHVWCFLGDGAEEEGHFYEAVLFADGHDLPCKFVIEDNDRSVDSNKDQRRGPEHGSLSAEWPACVQRYNYTPFYPHAGNGTKKKITFAADVVARHAQDLRLTG